jgi:2-methylisocitrate lyase-like PEP mutase family enzyme
MQRRGATTRNETRAGPDGIDVGRATQSLEARRRAELFHGLHGGSGILILVNAWDAGSARVIEAAGGSAVATTSAGMAWSLGYADGERVPLDEFIAACARICRAVTVPVSVDIERGFGRTTEEVCALVRALIELGVVGVNIEDGIVPGAEQAGSPAALGARIEALRTLTRRMNARLFINARTDTYLVRTSDRKARYEDTVGRAQLYASAGADGIFVPGMDLQDVAPFARAVSLPLNVYAGGGWAPPAAGLRQAGVRRVSLGCGPLQSAFALLRSVAREAFRDGTSSLMSRSMLGVDEINALFPAPGEARTVR